MKNLNELSENAQLLYRLLKSTGGGWIDSFIEKIWNAPKYESNPNAQMKYWQYDANVYGNKSQKPVGETLVEFTPTDNYSSKVSTWYNELRMAGYANERNNGYNEYWIYPTK